MQIIASILTGSSMPTKEFPPRKISFDNQLSNDLKSGDIILYRSLHADFASNVIKHFTSSPYPHVEIHLTDGYDISATATGVSYVDIAKGEAVDIFRLKRELTREERLMIFAKAAQSVLKPYDYGNLFAFPFVNKNIASRLAANRAYICSELTAWIYNEANIKLFGDTPTPLISPADFGLNDLELEYIGTYLKGEKISGNYRNRNFTEKEDTKLGIGFADFLESISNRDEFYKAHKEMWEKVNQQ